MATDKDASKAFRLRKKWKNPEKSLKPEESAWLLDYEKRDGVSSEYTDAMMAANAPNLDDAPSEEPEAGGLPSLDFASAAPPPPPPPPESKQTDKSKGKGKSKGSKSSSGKRQRRKPSDFRSKYTGATMDRETVCVQVAGAYCGFLAGVGKRSAELGGMALPPEVIEKIVFPAAIACVDDWLPDTQAAPEVICMAAGGFQLGAYLVAKKRAQEPIEATGGYSDADEKKPDPAPEPDPEPDTNPEDIGSVWSPGDDWGDSPDSEVS